MKRFLSAVAGLTLAAVVAAPASAQSATELRTMRFGVYGGLSMPQGDMGDFVNTGYIVGGLLDWKGANIPVGLRFDVAYQSWGADEGEADLTNFHGTADAVFTVPTTGGISPYVLGGLGLYKFDCDDCDFDTEFGFNVGGGLNFNLGTLQTFAELRYHVVSVDDFDANHLPIVFGIKF